MSDMHSAKDIDTHTDILFIFLYQMSQLAQIWSLGIRSVRVTLCVQEHDMPDEVNIDELLDLKSDEERTHRLKVTEHVQFLPRDIKSCLSTVTHNRQLHNNIFICLACCCLHVYRRFSAHATTTQR